MVEPHSLLGIVNLMPRAETYEVTLLRALTAAERAFEPVWLRLETPAYASSDRARIEQVYVPLSAALDSAALDALIVSGAPVEELPYEAVTYWPELSEQLLRARSAVRSTLGLCWGGMALARLLGVEKVVFSEKLFGVYPLSPRGPEHAVVRALGPALLCPQSRHSGLDPVSLAAAAARGAVRLIAGSDVAGEVILESADARFLMHVGHPEYETQRLALEYRRDAAAGRTDVGLPHGYDIDDPTQTWAPASTTFFRAWRDTLQS
jgi:homoserine O-succinyltransferase/O-acetyltransferase